MLLLKLSVLHDTFEDTAGSHVGHFRLKVEAVLCDKVTRISNTFEVS